MAEEISEWLAANALGGIGGLLDALLVKADDLDDLKEMEEENVAEAISALGLKDMKVKKVKKAFAALRGEQPPSSPGPGPAAAAMAAFALPDGGTVEIGEEIGRGAFGVVHRGVMTERSGPKPVAIKRLGRGAQPRERERFIREVRPSPGRQSVPVPPAHHGKSGWLSKGKETRSTKERLTAAVVLRNRLITDRDLITGCA